MCNCEEPSVILAQIEWRDQFADYMRVVFVNTTYYSNWKHYMKFLQQNLLINPQIRYNRLQKLV